MPFIKTAFLGAPMTLNHYGAIRIRVRGSGNLKTTLYSYDEIYSDPQANISMSTTTAIPATALSNFTQMLAKLDLRTTEIDEIFEVSQIIVYVKFVGTSFPQ